MLYVYGSELKMNNSLLSKTAVLFFAYSAEEELRQKGLWNGQSLFEDLNTHTIRQIEHSGLDYFHFSEKEQVGDSFGQRFIHAIQSVFAQGYEYVITLGNDTPQLRTSHILKTVEHVHKGNFVVGPSTDGGFYIMGLSKCQFHAQEFLLLPWQTTNLRKSLQYLLRELGLKTQLLPGLMDLDSIQDVRRFIKRVLYIPISILKYLSVISLDIKPLDNSIDPIYLPVYISNYYNKGSPYHSS